MTNPRDNNLDGVDPTTRAVEQTHGRARMPRWATLLLSTLALLSLGLGVWGNHWGAPARWHGDEMYSRARNLLDARTIDPHHYPYGELHYYGFALLGVVPVKLVERVLDPRPGQKGTTADSLWARRDQVRVMQATRAVSASYAALLIVLIALLGAVSLEWRAGLLAAAFLAVNPYLVTISHFATADTLATLGFWAACAATYRYMQGGERGWLVAAALLGGIAIGLKSDRVVVVAPLLTAFVLARPRGPIRDLGLAALLLPIGFVLANPTIVTAPLEYVDGYVRDLVYQAVRTHGAHTYTAVVEYLWEGLGWPVFTLVLVTGGYGLIRAWRRDRRTAIWLLMTFIPYALLLLGRATRKWYAPMLFPGLLLLAAVGCSDALRRVSRRQARLGWVGIGAALGWSLWAAAMVAAQFDNDARDAAGRWIAQNAPAGSSILLAGYGPALPLDRYSVRTPIRSDWCSVAIEPKERVDRSPRYQAFRSALVRMERWLGGRLGTRVRPHPYTAWFDAYAGKCEAPVQSDSKPDYVVIVEGAETKELSGDVLASSYQLAQRFEYPHRGMSGPPMGFVNPSVDLYVRRQPESAPQR